MYPKREESFPEWEIRGRKEITNEKK